MRPGSGAWGAWYCLTKALYGWKWRNPISHALVLLPFLCRSSLNASLLPLETSLLWFLSQKYTFYCTVQRILNCMIPCCMTAKTYLKIQFLNKKILMGSGKQNKKAVCLMHHMGDATGISLCWVSSCPQRAVFELFEAAHSEGLSHSICFNHN